MVDERKEPEPKDTTRLEQVPQWAANLTKDLGGLTKDVTFIRVNMETLSGEFAVLRVDVRSLQQWRLDEERRRDVSITPPAMNSTGVRALIDGHPSQMDLETQSQLANLIVQHAKEKAELEAKLVTKNDVKDVVKEATALQTTALITEISQNKKLRVIAGLVAALVIGWLSRVATSPPAPVPQPQTVTVPK